MLAGIAILWQFIAINGAGIAATVSSFDPSTLLRFPLRFGRYFVLRLLLGLLTASTIVGCLALFAAAIGITVADTSLAPAAFVVLAIYAAMNIFFSRMIAVWLERWLATRRAREIFGALMALFFVSFQFLNFRRPKFRHSHRTSQHRANSWLNFLHAGTHPLPQLAAARLRHQLHLPAAASTRPPRPVRRAAAVDRLLPHRLRLPPAQAIPRRVPQRRRAPRHSARTTRTAHTRPSRRLQPTTSN
jgi:hypothetical protein